MAVGVVGTGVVRVVRSVGRCVGGKARSEPDTEPTAAAGGLAVSVVEVVLIKRTGWDTTAVAAAVIIPVNPGEFLVAAAHVASAELSRFLLISLPKHI